MRRVAADFGPIPEYAGESLDRVAALTEADYPLDGKHTIFISFWSYIICSEIPKRRKRRDRYLAAMAKLFKTLEEEE